MRFRLAEGEKNQLDPARDAQLIEDPEEVIPDGVFADVEFVRDLLIHKIVALM